MIQQLRLQLDNDVHLDIDITDIVNVVQCRGRTHVTLKDGVVYEIINPIEILTALGSDKYSKFMEK